MATAAAATDLGRAGDPIKPSATRGRAVSQVECLVRWRRWVVGQSRRPGCVTPAAVDYTWVPGGSGRAGGSDFSIWCWLFR